MKTKILIIFLFLIANAKLVSGQDTIKPEKSFKHYVGFGAGFTTGYGISYRIEMGKMGAQFNFGPLSVPGDYTTLSLGLTMLMRMSSGENSNLFLYLGNHAQFKRDHYQSKNGYHTYNDSWKYNSGIGIDVELNAKRKVVFNIMGGIGVYDSYDMISLTGEIGLHYRL